MGARSAPLARIRCAYGVTDMAGANRYLEKRYRRAHNTEFAVRAAEPASAFVEFIGANLGDVLCERFERTVGNDNCVRFNTLSLQIPADPHVMSDGARYKAHIGG